MSIARTVQSVATLQHPLAAQIMDRSVPLTVSFVTQVMRLTQFTWHGRRPTAGVDRHGQRRATNLDLLSVLAELHRRQARIELDQYQNALPWQAYADERHVGGTKRYGTITGLISHREQLSFSVRIKDESVLRTDGSEPALGAERCYQLADYNGAWHAGFKGLTWDYTTDERSYLERRQLLHDNCVAFSDYVHRNRRQSIYGAPYLLLKLLWQRIEDELSFYEAESRRLQRHGVAGPVDLAVEPRPLLAVGVSRNVPVPDFTMAVTGPEFRGVYATVSMDDLGYRLAHRSIRFLAETLRPLVQFVVRADEVAFYRFGLQSNFIASWIRGPAWYQDGPRGPMTIELSDRLRLSYQARMTEKRVAA